MTLPRAELVKVTQDAGSPDPVCTIVVGYDETMGWTLTAEAMRSQASNVRQAIGTAGLENPQTYEPTNPKTEEPMPDWLGYVISLGNRQLSEVLRIIAQMLPRNRALPPMLHYQLPEPDEEFVVTLRVDKANNIIVVGEATAAISEGAWSTFAAGMSEKNWPWVFSIAPTPTGINLSVNTDAILKLEDTAEQILAVMTS